MREVSSAGLRRVIWALVGIAVGIVVTLLLARLWPEDRTGPDPIPAASPTLGVGSPLHLVGPAHELFTPMTEPPRPLNTARSARRSSSATHARRGRRGSAWRPQSGCGSTRAVG